MKIKTASGITRFQEDKAYGTWFNKLFNVMKSTANCQPEQSIEPDSQNYDSSSDSEERGTNPNLSARKQEKKGNYLYLSMRLQKMHQRKEKKM